MTLLHSTRIYTTSLRWGAALLTVTALAACTSSVRAPVESRSLGGAPTARYIDPATLAGAEFAGKPGYYTVHQGDTIRSISRAYNLDWRDLVQWNNTWVPNPDVIEIGQVLRVVAPAGQTASAATSATVAAAPTTSTPATTKPRPAAESSSSGTAAEDLRASTNTDLIWPTKNTTIVTPFDDAKNKGIGIGGKEGDPVMASADGKVMYAGSGLRGYGNLIILKHNSTLLTVYAHNSKLLVKEGQSVSKGQTIAHMGKTDADRVKLHFEVRRNGKTVNPLSYLPPR
ncbi:MAG: peptidoglycan DD-metalloendopeptidase family protein [Brachymonas sp.]|jgi:lipoprotein NlpD|nr:peptidoglycan DD-metalloendopeptidase family protein [Brachymonas sp.]MBP6138734.1 peptidoglycan DD-metalloendopeptidase family protein [Brachymonas sp.]MBP6966293.1 peptidoglycan DD-metalloendopeptidase family protein [Brachymonas sp.]MBP7247186.1 peptidoglycan DD-metalloendopeptidase family protein [Brachymonas sp.]MBP7744095.1 peptidoglycan DD-metalloendopeptidase family protein [Brachymonas sp.]